ncbi:MAG: NCS2 family permease, partial [Corynebacterium sp.]|nr:NCS2 family permease [Corynebacterium sp.]
TIVTMPFTYSIANGIGVGFIMYAVMAAAAGKGKQVHWLMWLVAGLFVVFFAIDPIMSAIS